MSEFIYILENPSLVGIVKIGKTTREVTERVKELSSHTGIPTEFTVFKQYAVDDATMAECRIHARLNEYRVSENREFFRISVEEAAQIIEAMLQTESRTLPDPEREDALYFAATELAITHRRLWPGAIAGPLDISHEEAEQIIQGLKARGILDSQNELCGDLRGVHERRLREAIRQQREQEKAAIVRARVHYQMIQEVKELLEGLADPETGEEAEVSFDNDNGNLVVAVHGTEWVRSEAQKRLSALSN